MYRDILLDIPIRLVGAPPQTPDWTLPRPIEHACGVALRSLRSRLPAHPRRQYGARSASIKGILKTAESLHR